MKNIVCYGDSNTWGYDPAVDDRYAKNERWAGILKTWLKEEYRVIEQGLCGRTTRYSSTKEPLVNGLEDAIVCAGVYKHVDIAILMLGTNDCKDIYQAKVEDITEGIKQIGRVFQNTGADILLVAPVPMRNLEHSPFLDEFGQGAQEKSRKLSLAYKMLADKNKWQFLDAGASIEVSDYDGIHLDAENHYQLALIIQEKIRKMEGKHGR